jgi:GT2 family glycosyltransferase
MQAGSGACDGIAVGVPVRNEVERLPRLLAALARQRSAPPFVVALFFDNCDDGSIALVSQLAPTLPFAVVSDCSHAGGPPNAGAARRRAMALALRHVPAGILLTTDADSAPAEDWVTTNLAGLAASDIVAGRIVRPAERTPDLQDRIAAYYDRLHEMRRAIDPVPWESDDSHHWTSAASLAFRSATYRALDGFPAVGRGEDAAFADAAARAGYRLRRDAAAIVCTSGRRVGRAQGGFADGLSALDHAHLPPDTTHPDDEAWRFAMQAGARAAFASGEYATLARPLALPLAEIRKVAEECANGEAFAARIVGAPPGGLRSVSLPHAEALLAALVQGELEGAA